MANEIGQCNGLALYRWQTITWTIGDWWDVAHISESGLILALHPANERWRYIVTTSLIGWAQA